MVKRVTNDFHCNKENEITSIQEAINKIQHDIHGNGKDGIKSELAKIKEGQKFMSDKLTDLNTNVSALVKFQAFTQGSVEATRRTKIQTREIVNMTITLILAATAIIVAIMVT